MYTATIRHHSISRARSICAKTLQSAKVKASREFGSEFQDYEIVIFLDIGDRPPELVASRKVGAARWQTGD